jgi:serralysin
MSLTEHTGEPSLRAAQMLPATLDEMAAFLTDGYWQCLGAGRRSFDTGQGNEITVHLTGLTAQGRQLARWALEAWESVADLRFREVAAGAQIAFDDEDVGAYSASTTLGAGIVSSEVNVSRDWLSAYGSTIDGYSFQTYLHEIGHALGLGHQGPYDGSASYDSDSIFIDDSWQFSVMSYVSQVENTSTRASFAFAATAMMADIIAIQELYGRPDAFSATAGNTVYRAGASIGGYLGALLDATIGGEPSPGVYRGDPVAMTLYDRSGIDTVDLSPSITDDRLDLRPARFSDVGGLFGNLGIARGTRIENATGGAGNDTIIGNFCANALRGGGGRDVLLGGGNADRLYGNASGDILRGDVGADTLYGGYGRDTLRGGPGSDRSHGGPGADTFELRAGDGREVVRDFDVDDGDRVRLARDLWSGDLDREGVVSDYATINPYGHAVLRFDGGECMVLRNHADLDAFAEQLVIA